MKKIIIVGAGGAGAEALMVLRRLPQVGEALGFADDNPALHSQRLHGVSVLGPIAEVVRRFAGETAVVFHCSVGRNAVRQRLVAVLGGAGLQAITLIDPSAVVASDAVIGVGSYIGPLAFVGPGSTVGCHVLVNTGASVGHDSQLGDYAQLCPGARLSGHTRLGEGAFVGSNGVTLPGIEVGEWATIAAGSVAMRQVPARATVIGVPGKILATPSPTV